MPSNVAAKRLAYEAACLFIHQHTWRCVKLSFIVNTIRARNGGSPNKQTVSSQVIMRQMSLKCGDGIADECVRAS